MNSLSTTICHSGLRLIAISSLIIGLAACTSGDNDNGGGITLPTTPVTITTANAPQVAGAAIGSIDAGMSLPIAAQTSASTTTPSAVTSVQTLARIAQTTVQRIHAQGAAPATVTGVVETFNCTVSGTESYDTDPNITSGPITYNNCSYTAGETLNGTINYSNWSETATNRLYDAVFNLTVATTSPVNTLTATGDMHVASVTTDNWTTWASTVTGASLTLGNTGAQGNYGLQNYTIATDASGTITTMSFTFSSTAIGGTAAFAMTAPFASTGGQFPSSGAATITGAAQTMLRLTVLGDETAPVGSQIQLELSTDGGTNYAAPTYHTWAELTAI